VRPLRFLPRVVGFGVGVLLLAGAGTVLYHYVSARMAQELALDPPARAAAEVAKAEWRRQVDVPTLRLVVTAGEEYGEGNYLFVLDVYRWLGVGRGYATVRSGLPGAGGTLSRGGDPFEDAEVEYIRAQWAEEYGPGRRLGERDKAASALPRSMKGYELYSWREGDGWRFGLITGTNRSKTCAEITGGEERVTAGGGMYCELAGFPS
jgi:hypothetical protein